MSLMDYVPDSLVDIKNQATQEFNKRVESAQEDIVASRAATDAARIKAIRGQAADLSQYSIESMTYPKDLMSKSEYGGNYAMFFINIQSASKLQELSGTAGIVANAVTGISKNISDISSGVVELQQFGTGFLQGGAAGSILGSIFKSWGGSALTIGGAVATGGVRAAATGVVANESGGFSLPTKRLKTAIALNMPLALSVRYSMNYEETEIPLSMQIMGEMGSAISASTGVMNSAINAGVAAKSGVEAIILNTMGTDTYGAISKLSKIAVNPTKEQIFKGVDFRIFNFNYLFAPRNSEEAANVLEIINQFKFHMHPEFTDNTNFLYIYPSEFDIIYYANGKENTNVHRHTSCVLTDLALNYAPNGIYTTFPDGMPTQIDMTLTFKELAKLDKEKIKEGKF